VVELFQCKGEMATRRYGVKGEREKEEGDEGRTRRGEKEKWKRERGWVGDQ